MRNIILTCLAITAILLAGTSCSDSTLEEPNEITVCTFGRSELDYTHILKGHSFYDSINKVIAIAADTASFDDTYRNFVRKRSRFIFYPYVGESLGIEADKNLSFRTNRLSETLYSSDSSIIMVKISDVEEIPASSNSFQCASFGYDQSRANSFDTDFKNEIVTDKSVRVFFHLLRWNSGVGFPQPEQTSRKIINGLNQAFSQARIYFHDAGYKTYNYISSGMSCDLGDEEFIKSTFTAIPSHEDGINIYIVCNMTGNTNGVHHRSYPNSYIIQDDAEIFTWAHEMGHCLGLRHTHFGTELARKNVGETGGKPEYVNGSNGDSAGDYMVDTPADPNVWTNGRYSGTYKDENGESYNPDPTNYMSYSWVGGYFSPLQIKKMHKTLRKELPEVLMNANIQGPLHFASNGSYTHDLTNSEGLEWHIIRHQTPKSDDTPAIIKEEGWSNGILNLTSSCSEFLEIQVRTSQSHIILGSTSATTGAPTPVTGSLLWRTKQYGTWEGITTNMAWGETLYISENTTIYLGYEDRAGANLTSVNYRTVTAANRVLSGSTISVTKADCSKGYLKFKLSDSCGQGDGYFTIPVTVIGGYYAVNTGSPSQITFLSVSGASPGNRPGIRPKAPVISSIEIFTVSGQFVQKIENIDDNSLTIYTESWTKGDYIAILHDGDNYHQEIPFTI